MSAYKRLKFKMKVSYERWMKGLKMGQLLHMAVYRTVVQRQRQAQFELNQYTSVPEYNHQHGLFHQV